jgi:23S rRNA U2552 (ribose-2'-O)-methylase RlmE/FtsJ
MELSELAKNYQTDKYTAHCYIEHLYSKIFPQRKDSTKNILEIGVYVGESIRLWRDYFTNASIYALDFYPCEAIKNSDRINHIIGDAYSPEIIDQLHSDFDIIIDDGPHTLNSMQIFLSKYTTKLNSSGVLILEDIQDYDHIENLKTFVPESLRHKIQIYDLRKIQNRYDDLVMVINLGEEL